MSHFLKCLCCVMVSMLGSVCLPLLTVPCRPMTLLMTTMWPDLRFFMSGITSLIMRTMPKKFVSNTFFISSILMLSMGPRSPIPALLTEENCLFTSGLLERGCYSLPLLSSYAEDCTHCKHAPWIRAKFNTLDGVEKPFSHRFQPIIQ